MKEQILKFVTDADQKIYDNMQEFSQFTIDFFESLRSDLEDSVDTEEENTINGSPARDFIGSMSYNAENIIEICKDGADKELFDKFNEFMEGLIK